MESRKKYRQAGYQRGFEDAKRTGGKIKQETIDKYLNAKTKNLPPAYSMEFMEGWQEGFKDGVGDIIWNLARNDYFWENNILWEDSTFKNS